MTLAEFMAYLERLGAWALLEKAFEEDYDDRGPDVARRACESFLGWWQTGVGQAYRARLLSEGKGPLESGLLFCGFLAVFELEEAWALSGLAAIAAPKSFSH